MRFLLILTAALAVSACSIIYKLPTRQGNVIDQKQVDQLQVGMTREQVQFLMGTAVASSPLTENEWDYVGYYKSPHGVESQRTVTVYFNGNVVSRIDGQQLPGAEDVSTQGTDPSSVIKRRKKEAHEDARAASERAQDSGVSQPAPGEIPKAP